jgi:hypothetical protein
MAQDVFGVDTGATSGGAGEREIDTSRPLGRLLDRQLNSMPKMQSSLYHWWLEQQQWYGGVVIQANVTGGRFKHYLHRQ